MKRLMFLAAGGLALCTASYAALQPGATAPDFTTEATLAGKPFTFSLAAALKSIVAQQLCPTKDGKGRCAAVEILTYASSLPNLIRTGKASSLVSLIETSGASGMQSMDQCLMRFYTEGRISGQIAYLKCQEKKRFRPLAEKEEEEAKEAS